jgi:Ca2+-binding RTX toxin-like protein
MSGKFSSGSSRLGVAVLLAALAILAVAAAPASAGWSKPVSLSGKDAPYTFGDGPAVAARPDQSYVAAWLNSLPGPTSVGVIEARTISAAGKPGPLLHVAPKGDVRAPRLAVGADGSTLITWTRLVAPQQIALEGRFIGADGKLGPEFSISGPDGRILRRSAAVDATGKATVAWANQIVDSSTLRVRQVDATGPVGPEQTLTKTLDGRVTTLGTTVGPDKRPLIAYTQFGRIKFVRLGTNGLPEGQPKQITPETDTVGDLEASIDAQGQTRLTWSRLSPNPLAISTLTIGSDNTVGPTETVSNRRSASPGLGVSSSGAAAITWQDTPAEPTDPEQVLGLAVNADGSFGAKLPLSQPSATAGMDPRVSLDERGIATSVWTRDTGGSVIVEAARYSVAGAESKVAELSVPSDFTPAPNVASASDGTALATWWQGSPDEETEQVRAAIFTPSGVGSMPISVPPDPLSPPPEPPAECKGEAATIVGSSYGDEMRGTKGDDVIVGRPGDDTIRGRGGDDLICGNGGDDELRGGGGKDKLVGGPGKNKQIQG